MILKLYYNNKEGLFHIDQTNLIKTSVLIKTNKGILTLLKGNKNKVTYYCDDAGILFNTKNGLNEIILEKQA